MENERMFNKFKGDLHEYVCLKTHREEMKVNIEDILKLEVKGTDIGDTTVKGYLIALLAELWREGEGFSGKRPFGNSGWEYDLYCPLVESGVVTGEIEDDCLEAFDRKAADTVIMKCIKAL